MARDGRGFFAIAVVGVGIWLIMRKPLEEPPEVPPSELLPTSFKSITALVSLGQEIIKVRGVDSFRARWKATYTGPSQRAAWSMQLGKEAFTFAQVEQSNSPPFFFTLPDARFGPREIFVPPLGRFPGAGTVSWPVVSNFPILGDELLNEAKLRIWVEEKGLPRVWRAGERMLDTDRKFMEMVSKSFVPIPIKVIATAATRFQNISAIVSQSRRHGLMRAG